MDKTAKTGWVSDGSAPSEITLPVMRSNPFVSGSVSEDDIEVDDDTILELYEDILQEIEEKLMSP